MIYIKEIIPDKNSVVIRPEGILDLTPLPILEEVLKDHSREGKEFYWTWGLLHVSREAKDFLQEIQGLINPIRSQQFKKKEPLAKV